MLSYSIFYPYLQMYYKCCDMHHSLFSKHLTRAYMIKYYFCRPYSSVHQINNNIDKIVSSNLGFLLGCKFQTAICLQIPHGFSPWLQLPDKFQTAVCLQIPMGFSLAATSRQISDNHLSANTPWVFSLAATSR